MLGFGALSESALGELPSAGGAPVTYTGAGSALLELFAVAAGAHGIRGAAAATLDITAAGVARHYKRVVATTQGRWGSATPHTLETVVSHGAAQTEDARTGARWGAGIDQDAQGAARWDTAAARDGTKRSPWLFYLRHAEPIPRARWGLAVPKDEGSHSPWGRYERRLQPEQFAAWIRSQPADDASRSPWGGPMRHLEQARGLRYGRTARADLTQWVPWVRFSRTLQPSVGVFIPPDDGLPTALIVVPVRRVYMQVNATSLRRVVGNIPLPTFNMRMGLDRDSWVWSFSASMPADTQPYLESETGEPVEVEASVNGENFRFLVEHIARERSFGSAAISVSGRGKAALLDAPNAPVKTFTHDEDLTLQQLMNSVLTEGGVSIGWGVNFAPEDWLVPAGVFSHRGSYITALNELAAAAGAYVQPHATLDEVSVLLQYPHAPWNWLTDVDPDYELPSATVTREGIEWVTKPRYNRVYVSGVQSGVLGRVTRAGTAGDLVAPLITHALITDAIAARQRGLPVLADVGRKANVSLRLPVLDETGVIVPGKFVRYVDGATERVGLVRGVDVDIPASPQVWQTIQLETHLEPV